MSRRKEIITVEPSERISKEAFCTSPMACPYCGGRGWHYSGKREPDTEACPDCAGSGEVYAIVTIEWKPNDKTI